MKPRDPIYIVDIIGEVCSGVSVETNFNVNYQYGLAIQILESLKSKDGSVTLKSTKYPLIGLYLSIEEDRGNGYYSDVLIRRIVIANLTKANDRPVQRYEKVFKTILYPVYYSFLKQLARNKYIGCKDPDMLKHKKFDYPGVEPVTGINDFVDTIEIINLQFPIKQIKNC